MTKFLFDIDGVVRHLSIGALGREALCWNDADSSGCTVFEIVDSEPELCCTSPPTDLMHVVNTRMNEVEFLSAQPEKWRPHTDVWLRSNVRIPFTVRYVNAPNEKLQYLSDEVVLLDDYPKFDSYEHVVLVERPYNIDCAAIHRIKNAQDLIELLEVTDG